MRGAIAALSGMAVLAAVAPVDAQQPSILREAPLVGRSVEFHAVVHPDTVYVGQQANYQVGVFLGDDVRARLRRNPEFTPPEMAGVLGYDLPVTHEMVAAGSAGRYEAHVFERAIFPLTEGVLEIPAARLSYSLPLSRSFFSREESFMLRTEPVRLVALPPPTVGRPPDFAGAVGSELRLELDFDPTGVRVGNPLLVTARVSGRGNLNLLPRPRLELSWGNVVAAAERVTLDTTTRSIRGTKEFDWLITPRVEGGQRLPAVTYDYFDPELVAYTAATAPAESVRVGAGTLAALDSTATLAVASLTVRERWRGPTPRGPADSPIYWLAVVVLPLPAIAARVRRRRPRTPTRLSALERLTRLAAVQPSSTSPSPISLDIRQLRSLTIAALGDRLSHTTLPYGEEHALARALRLEGVTVPTAAGAAALVAELDRATFCADAGAAATDVNALAGRALAMVTAVDAEARRGREAASFRAGRPGRSRERIARRFPMVLLTVATAGALLAVERGWAASVSQTADGTTPVETSSHSAPVVAGQGADGPDEGRLRAARVTFELGVEHYLAGDFAFARDSFREVAAQVPTSVEAWANAGTAAWAMEDSAGAAEGWQRAVRLQPASDELRQRLSLLPAGQLSGAAALPPFSSAAMQWLALVAWAAAWGLAFRGANAGDGIVSVATMAMVALVVGSGAGAALLSERAMARDLAVVNGGAQLRSLPALSAAVRRQLSAGEVVRVRARSGVWSLVQRGTERGWLESGQIRSLRAD